MSENPPEPGHGTPTSKELRDARRQAHAEQKSSTSNKGGDKKGMMGKGGARKP